MAYAYITQLDLDTGIFRTLQHERNDEDTVAILENIELQNIELIKTKLNGRYDIDAIFQATGINRHYLIIKILTALIVYDFIRRNAARKVPKDATEDWEWAMKLLEQIKSGKETPDGLPDAVSENGDTIERLLWKNNKNKDFYI